MDPASASTGPGTEPPGDRADRADRATADHRSSLRPASELPERRPRRREVRVDGVDESLAPIVERAVALVRERAGADAEQVVVEAAGSVTWSDRSCGCPEPGRAYPQVPVDGVYVRLTAGGRQFHVHGGGRRGLFVCDN